MILILGLLNLKSTILNFAASHFQNVFCPDQLGNEEDKGRHLEILRHFEFMLKNSVVYFRVCWVSSKFINNYTYVIMFIRKTILKCSGIIHFYRRYFELSCCSFSSLIYFVFCIIWNSHLLYYIVYYGFYLLIYRIQKEKSDITLWLNFYYVYKFKYKTLYTFSIIFIALDRSRTIYDWFSLSRI
jgi:hypothetical protein